MRANSRSTVKYNGFEAFSARGPLGGVDVFFFDFRSHFFGSNGSRGVSNSPIEVSDTLASLREGCLRGVKWLVRGA